MAFQPASTSYSYTAYPQRSVSELALALSQEECTVENHSDVYDSSGVGDTPENVGLDSILAPRSNTTNAAKSKIPVQINYRKISAEENSRSRVKLPRNKSFDSTAKFLKKNDETSRRFRSFSSLLRQNFDSSKTRKVSTPEIQRRPFDRRCSLESHELKSDRLQIILAKHASSYLHLEDSTEAMSVVDSGSSLIEINENAISTPTSRSRKLSNIFRKKSTHSKSSKENEHLRGRKYGCSNRMSLGANDLDGVIRERDRALEEWGKSATKCEELIEELEFTLSQLIIIRNDRDEKTEELKGVIINYDNDLDDREAELDDLQEELNETRQLLAVARTERTEAFDQRDELLQQSYLSKQEVETVRTELDNAHEDNINLRQKCTSLEEEVLLLKKERDDALKLWNTTVEERKKLHDEQILLTQARDESLRKTFGQLEEISVLKSERNQLLRHIESIKRGVGYKEDSNFGEINRHDSGFNSTTSPDKMSGDETSATTISVSTSEDDHFFDDYQEIAICIDTFDSRHGLKLDNAIDIPHVMVTFVTSQLEQKWNIKKHDRIISVNGVSVSRADKKTVERLIRDTAGRTISLVLRRERLVPGEKNQADIEIGIDKQPLEMQYFVEISNTNENSTIHGLRRLKKGDRIMKINSQDINDVMSTMIKKLGKRTNGKATLRIVRKEGFTKDDLIKPQNEAVSPTKSSIRASISFNNFPRRKRSTTYSDFSVAKSVFSDVSSLFSDVSEPQSITEDTIYFAMRSCTDSMKIPEIQVETLPVLELNNSPQSRPKTLLVKRSPRLNTSLLNHLKPSKSRVLDDISIQSSEFSRNLKPSPRHSRRSSPALRRSVSTLERKTERPVLTYSNDDFSTLHLPRSNSSDLSLAAASETPFTNLPGYATLPRRYKRRINTEDKKQTTRVIRMEKHATDIIGITITGGNKVGIFVKELAPDSVAELSGLKVGDRILHLNSSDLTKATLDFATRSLLSHRSCIKLRVEVAFYENFDTLLEQKPYESIYVRCLQQYTAVNSDEISFEIGDIFHITDTLHNFDIETLTWSWYGTRTVKKTLLNVEGVLPRIETYIEEPKSPTPIHTDNDVIMDDRRKKRLLKLNKSANDLKKWFGKKPSFITKKRKSQSRGRERTFSFNDLRRNVFYEILLEEPVFS